MVNLLDIHVEIITPAEIGNYERVAIKEIKRINRSIAAKHVR